MMKNHTILWCICLLVALVLTCSTDQLTGGSSSTDNGKIMGKVCNENGSSAPRATVILHTADFNPTKDSDTATKALTDSTGTYIFDSLAQGIYTLEATAMENGTRALINAVMVDTTTTHAASATLKKPGALSIELPDKFATSGYVYIPGTSLYGLVNSGIAFIDSVPAGYIPALYYANSEKPESIRSIKTGIVVASGSTRKIADYATWNHTARIFLNTTKHGADIANNVHSFPLLVRLSASNFIFAEAQPNGADLRFSTLDNTPLPFDIERWDAADGHAEIWVLIDTVLGNDSLQSFIMSWGNSLAKATTNSAVVFDTARGYQGVWHMSGTDSGTAYDATVNKYNGTPVNMTSASSVTGAIGTARDFNGTTSYITMPSTADSKLNFPQDGAYTMSLWAYADTIDSLWHAIAGKGHEQYYMQLKGLGSNRATWEFVEFQDQLGWEYTEDSTPPAPSSKNWVYLTGIRSGSTQRFFINGIETVDTASLMAGVYDRNSSNNFSIGSYEEAVVIPYKQGRSFFNGKIDEIRLLSRALSADEVRLCYMNQKTDDILVKIDR